jgi:hypothetical protein
MGAIPVWMTDPVTCAGFSLGDPLVSIEALTNLRAVLDSLRSSAARGADHPNPPGDTSVEQEQGAAPSASADQPFDDSRL